MTAADGHWGWNTMGPAGLSARVMARVGCSPIMFVPPFRSVPRRDRASAVRPSIELSNPASLRKELARVVWALAMWLGARIMCYWDGNFVSGRNSEAGVGIKKHPTSLDRAGFRPNPIHGAPTNSSTAVVLAAADSCAASIPSSESLPLPAATPAGLMKLVRQLDPV